MPESDPKQNLFSKLANTKPVLPIVADHPLADKKADRQDKFELCYTLGPVFDIIRHKDTQTPTAIAIYGDWGTGKTSAMKWLEGLIAESNKVARNTTAVKVHAVWFYPWKYHDKEDVWRGLISEVITASIKLKGATVARVTKAAKQFGLFLGKGFIHLLGGLKLKAGAKKIGEAEFDLSCIQDILNEYNQTVHPEKAFLNEFEHSLKEWIEDTITAGERLVIFIDDLDRCMPDIALQVLEALKLYLNIEKLVFVVGVDDKVINPLVKKYYEKLGVEKYKSDNYLAKMFQTEVHVGPSEDQVSKYLDYHLDNAEYFKETYLTPKEKPLFRNLINSLANRNPREVKRLINSAVMAGAGAEMIKHTGQEDTPISFKQGLQVFFIRKILSKEPYNLPRFVGSTLGNSFFAEWSQIVCNNIKTNPDFPTSLPMTPNLSNVSAPDEDLDEETREHLSDFIPEPYHGLLKNPQFTSCFQKDPDFACIQLLTDKNLGRLMTIKFSTEIAAVTQKAEPAAQPSHPDSDRIIREAIARKINKSSDQLTDADYLKVEELHLSLSRLSDVSALEELKNLTTLYLAGNQLSDVSALKELKNLTTLDLDSNQLSDVSALKELKNLTALSLACNQLSDVSALEELKNLTRLDLYNNQLSDVSALEELKNLTTLYLQNNQLSDVSALKELKNLTGLYLAGNQLSDVSALKELKNLTKLSLDGNQLSDVSALKELKNLTELYLGSNQLSDVSALKELKNLTILYLAGNQLSDKQIANLKKALPEADITA